MNNSTRNVLTSTENIMVVQSPIHGDGVCAIQPIKMEEVVYLEKPHYFLQALPNRRNVLVCGSCSQYLGSVGLQIKLLQSCITREDILCGRVMDDFHHLHPLSDHILPCFATCGELYCSVACRNQHWNARGHKYLCTGQIGESQADTHPLIAFKMHAVQTNEIFLMVADVFAELCAIYEEQCIKQGAPREVVLAALAEHFSGFVRQRWWEAAQPPKGQSKAKFAKTLKTLVKDSHCLLAAALPLEQFGLKGVLTEDFMARYSTPSPSPPPPPPLCTLTETGILTTYMDDAIRCIGMFEQNNVGVHLRNSVAELIQRLTDEATEARELPAAAAAAAAAAARAPIGETQEIVVRAPEELQDAQPVPDTTRLSSMASALLEELQVVASTLEAEEQCMDEECYEDVVDDEEEMEEEEEEEMSGQDEAQLAIGEGDELADIAWSSATGHTEVDAIHQLLHDYTEEVILPPLDGTAFYFLTCKINHSCSPNVLVKYTHSPEYGLAAQLVALRAISPGEELVQSYIDPSLSTVQRQRLLAEYGFACNCAKCAQGI